MRGIKSVAGDGLNRMEVWRNMSEELPRPSEDWVRIYGDFPQPDPYQFTCNGVKLDPYRVARIYGITDPVIFQALKKLLRCGRKHKDIKTDVREAVTSLLRWEEMNEEDSRKLEQP